MPHEFSVVNYNNYVMSNKMVSKSPIIPKLIVVKKTPRFKKIHVADEKIHQIANREFLGAVYHNCAIIARDGVCVVERRL